MGEWTEVQGGVKFPKDAHFSLKKSIDKADIAAECVTIEYKPNNGHNFRFVLDYSGDVAYNHIRKWLKSFPEGTFMNIRVNLLFCETVERNRG